MPQLNRQQPRRSCSKAAAPLRSAGDPGMEDVYELMEQVAETDITLPIRGESETGKELDERVHEQLRAVEPGGIRARITVAQGEEFTTFPILLIPHRYTDPDGAYFNVVIELSTVQTAKPVGSGQSETLRSSLERIALELQTIGLSSEMIAPPVVPLDHPDLASLTEREREVLVHLVAGQRVPAIATEFHISQHTVRNHLKSIFRKLGVGNQSELIERVRNLDDPKN
jgi:DNA-binding CsgD family transcriptional regulator